MIIHNPVMRPFHQKTLPTPNQDESLDIFQLAISKKVDQQSQDFLFYSLDTFYSDVSKLFV